MFENQARKYLPNTGCCACCPNPNPVVPVLDPKVELPPNNEPPVLNADVCCGCPNGEDTEDCISAGFAPKTDEFALGLAPKSPLVFCGGVA